MLERQVAVNEISLAVQVEEPAGEPLLFLHFSGANMRQWARAVPFFQEQYPVMLVDLRGHGHSARPDTGYHMDQMAADVIGVLDALDIPRTHVVGSSLGAEVGLSLAANYPERVLSLVGDGALFSEREVWAGTAREYEQHVAEQLEKIASRPEATFPSVAAYVDSRRDIFADIGWWNEYVAAMERRAVVEVAEGEYRKAFGKSALIDYMTHYYGYHFADYYRRVQCPLLLLPDPDDQENEAIMAVITQHRDLSAQGKIVTVEEWLHPYGWLVDPERMCRTIMDFLAECAAG